MVDGWIGWVGGFGGLDGWMEKLVFNAQKFNFSYFNTSSLKQYTATEAAQPTGF